MGKQINFYMDEFTENNFLEFVKNEGFKLFYEDADEERLKEIDKISELSKRVRKIYIYKDSFGEVVSTSYANYRIENTASSVIEFIRTLINDEKKYIYQGRVWIEDKYYKDGNLIGKSAEFINSYDMICKWIKKNIKKSDIVKSGRTSKEYINDTLKIKLDEGYLLRI